ncbi:hypothetical protein L195_g020156 [Trifolium pratense]|uniref:Uncharacterized protein n=1 Tax=Trifolium pratense TaxID=57577 RepID=A0A2K3N1S5_TRIPR|nr:hypothetical protein L195_g020156 [Trifolium pratense]
MPRQEPTMGSKRYRFIRGYSSCMAVVVTSVKTDERGCFLANLGSEIRDFQDLHTHWNWMRDFTGSLERISTISSNGRVGSGGDDGGFRVPVKEDDGGVRVPLEEEFKHRFLVEVVSSISEFDEAASFGSPMSLLGAIPLCLWLVTSLHLLFN